MEHVYAIERLHRPNRLMMTVMLTYPSCSNLVMKEISNWSIFSKKTRLLELALKDPNLVLSSGNNTASLSVQLDGIDDEAKVLRSI